MMNSDDPGYWRLSEREKWKATKRGMLAGLVTVIVVSAVFAWVYL